MVLLECRLGDAPDCGYADIVAAGEFAECSALPAPLDGFFPLCRGQQRRAEERSVFRRLRGTTTQTGSWSAGWISVFSKSPPLNSNGSSRIFANA